MDKSKAIIIAATWWADQLKSPLKPDSGDDDHDFVLTWAVKKAKQPTKEQIDTFQACLEDELIEKLKGCVWDEDDPHQASYFRAVGVDWGPDDCLRVAAEKAAIDTLLFPVKTMMWINPDGVRVRMGYGREIKIIQEVDTFED